MLLSDHAKERLKERFGFFKDIEINDITSMFFTKPHFKTIKIEKKNIICYRQIRYKGKNIQAIVDPIHNIIETIIPDFIIWEDHFEGYDLLCEKIRILNFKIKKLIILEKENNNIKKIEIKKLKKENNNIKEVTITNLKKKIMNIKKIRIKKLFKIGSYFIGKELNDNE